MKDRKFEIGSREFMDEWRDVTCDFFCQHDMTIHEAIRLLSMSIQSLVEYADQDQCSYH